MNVAVKCKKNMCAEFFARSLHIRVNGTSKKTREIKLCCKITWREFVFH